MMGRPSESTAKKLFALTGNLCAFPGCPTRLVNPSENSANARICHIKGNRKGSARYDERQTEKDRQGFANLVAMCAVHSDIIDNPAMVEKYSVAWLLDVKAKHEAKCSDQPVDEELAEEFAEKAIDRIFQRLEEITERTLTTVIQPLDTKLDYLHSHLAQLLAERTISAPIDKHSEPDIARAKVLVDAFHFKDALSVLLDVESTKWSELSSDDKFLLLTLRGRANFIKGDPFAAGECYLRARELCKGKERAETNYAVGLELTGKTVEAVKHARDVIAAFPGAVRPWAVVVRSESNDLDAAALFAQLPPHAESDEEVRVGLANRSMRNNDLAFAQELLEPLAARDGDWPMPYLLLAQVRVHRLIERATKLLDGSLFGFSSHDVQQTLAILDKAFAVAIRTNDRYLQAECLMLRGEFRSAFNDFAEARNDFLSVPFEHQTSSRYLTKYGRLLGISGHEDQALRVLNTAFDAAPDSDTAMLIALKLRSQNDEKNPRYRELLCICVRDEDCSQRHLAFLFLLECILENGAVAVAKEVVATSCSGSLGGVVEMAASLWVLHHTGESLTSEKASDLATKALADGSDWTLLFVGEVLQRTGCRREALPVWMRRHELTHTARDVHRLVDSAFSNNRLDIVLDVCRKWRERGVYDPHLVESEISCLEQHAPLKALEVIEGYLPFSKNPKHVTLWRLWIKHKLGNLEKSGLSVDELPTPDEAGATDGRVVAHMLCLTEQFEDAWRYLYRLFKAHTRDESVCGTLASIGLQFPEINESLPNHTVVESGCCVEYRPIWAQQSRWLLIEDDQTCELLEHEVRPSDPLAVLFVGHKVGDMFDVASYDGTEVSVEIIEIHNKFAFRAAKLRDDWQFLFPNSDTIRHFQITRQSDLELGIWDISPMYRALHRPKRLLENVVDVFAKSGTQLLFQTARSTGKDPLEVQWAILSSENPVFHCNNTSLHGFETSTDSLVGKSLVIEMSAVGTMWHLGILEKLTDVPHRILISPSTWTSLLAFKRSESRSQAHVAEATTGGIGIRFRDVELAEVVERRRYLESAVLAISKSVTVTDCDELYRWGPELRFERQELLGDYATEALALSKQMDAVLWTDDNLVASAASSNPQVPRVWTQSILLELRKMDLLTDHEYHTCVAKLLASGYQATVFNLDTLFVAAEESQWSPQNWLLKGVLRECVIKQPSARRIDFVSEAIAAVYDTAVIDPRKDSVVCAMLDCLLAGVHEEGSVSLVVARVKKSFGVRNGVRSHFQNVLEKWKSFRLMRLS